MNHVNVSFFTPALLFPKVAFFLSPLQLRELWIIPIFFVMTTLVSKACVQSLGWALRIETYQRAIATAAGFMNSNTLTIALM
ncbi:uncharacterized protein C8Q71DRAFT_733051 [Rhodofomes roseus]|uniref:Uncharacterized protein n=1 Tax=Rhodofomes roseus TaxID=34475 RepID=A0ABQ8KVC5_9APHY|nr:uncharacterized protein C8Q71DRAFT_733051 [Rhodofomes roseus]KAH9842484.1 hypothetical protein C8Q71DRAFT_733051 [Rhodofomes roseus]